MSNTAHRVRVTVGNISDEYTAVAVATNWLRDVIPAIDIAEVDAQSGRGETDVDFILRLSDEDVSAIESSSSCMYLGEI